MTTVESCNGIRATLVSSGLHYFVKESPHSLWISVKKKFIDENVNTFVHQPDVVKDHGEEKIEMILSDLEGWKEQYYSLLKNYNSVKAAFEEEINDHQTTTKDNMELQTLNQKNEKVINNILEEKRSLQNDINNLESDLKRSIKTLKLKENEIYDLKKEKAKAGEDLQMLEKELRDFKSKANQEKKTQIRKLKKEEKKDFLNNMKVESKKDEFACDKCNLKFPSTEKLIAHTRNVHVSQKSSQTEEKLVEDKFIQHTLNYKDKIVQTCGNVFPEGRTMLMFEKYPCY